MPTPPGASSITMWSSAPIPTVICPVAAPVTVAWLAVIVPVVVGFAVLGSNVTLVVGPAAIGSSVPVLPQVTDSSPM